MYKVYRWWALVELTATLAAIHICSEDDRKKKIGTVSRRISK